MTIRNINSDETINGVLSSGERGRTYRLLCSRLSSSELSDIRSTLDEKIEGCRIETASWIPGSDLWGTPYQAIYQKGARMNTDLAALMFGRIVWEAFERHEDDWHTERFSTGGEEDRFRVYFKEAPKPAPRRSTVALDVIRRSARGLAAHRCAWYVRAMLDHMCRKVRTYHKSRTGATFCSGRRLALRH